MALENKNTGQQSAADPAVSSWVSASAGTGKTHVLTDRVLRLLLSGTLPERILCLTFTKAAAAQMEQRVFQRLGEWTGLGDGELAETLVGLLGREADPGEMVLARRLFARALETPGGLKIQTIHSFCESVLGRFPLEAGLSANFQVMDERTAEELFLDARQQVLLQDSVAEEPMLGALAEFLDEDSFQNIMQLLMSERGRLNRLFHLSGGITGVMARMRQVFDLGEHEDRSTILAGFCDEGRFESSGLRHLANKMVMSGTSKNDVTRGQIIADWLSDGANRSGEFEGYRLAFYSKSSDAPYKTVATAKLVRQNPELEGIIAGEIERIEEVTAKLRALRLVRANACLLQLASAMIDAYEIEKHRRAQLDYDDLILKTRDLVVDRTVAPWVLYKMDGGLDHILIDEAQDTNPEQWEIIQALAEEFFTGSGAREESRTVFAVGDPKQSIYSFQRADPSGFSQMQGYFKGRVEAADRFWRPVELNLSYRSVPAVLRLVDQVFEGTAAQQGVLFTDHRIRHVSERRMSPGLV
jgi:ATP-dependent helicase/nuclease subunit A